MGLMNAERAGDVTGARVLLSSEATDALVFTIVGIFTGKCVTGQSRRNRFDE